MTAQLKGIYFIPSLGASLLQPRLTDVFPFKRPRTRKFHATVR